MGNFCKPSTHNLPHHHRTVNDAPTTIAHHPRHHNLSTTTMPTRTHSNKPCNCSRLQHRAPAAEKWKHAESGADKTNKKPKVTTNKDADNVNNDLKVTGRGKRQQGARERAPKVQGTLHHCHITPFRKMAANRAQDDAAADAARLPEVSPYPPFHPSLTAATSLSVMWQPNNE